MLALGEAIRNYRLRKGLSQKKLAELSGITPIFLSKVENHHRMASLTVIERIAGALNITIDTLVWESVELPKGMNESDRKICEKAKKIIIKLKETR